LKPITRRGFALSLAASALYSGPLVLLTDEEAKLIEALTNQIIPSDDAPGAVEAGVVYYIDKQLAGPLQRFEPIYQNWAGKAERGLESGMQYSCAIGNRRVRAATVLPALIGARTLALLREAGASALHRRIKVSRREVRRIIASIAIALGSGRKLDATFRRLL